MNSSIPCDVLSSSAETLSLASVFAVEAAGLPVEDMEACRQTAGHIKSLVLKQLRRACS